MRSLNYCDFASIFNYSNIKGGKYMWRIKYLADVLKEEKGIGVVEVILILVVLIGLVLIFKSQLNNLVETIFQKITSESAGI